MRFSEYFKLNLTQPYLDFVDIPLDTDLEVFLDPTAIKSLKTPWGNLLAAHLQSFFQEVLDNIKSDRHKDAQVLLAALNERNEFHFGYSKGKSQGSGFGAITAQSVWKALTKSHAAKSGMLVDLEDAALMIEGVGRDMISDASCNILRGPLIKYTQDACAYHDIQLTPGVVSGPIWNPNARNWESDLLSLPMTSFGKVILVPKILVRKRIAYDAGEYYNHYLLPELQTEHKQANSSLVEVLKDGTRRVTKESLKRYYGTGKQVIVKETEPRPQVLQHFRQHKAREDNSQLTLAQFSELQGEPAPNVKELTDELKNLPSGKDHASEYENIIEKILSILFYPSLCNPCKQREIHDGRKRIDITYSNEARSGFFHWLSMHYSSALIFVECKNYGKELGNPELDQIAGRFSPSRGKFGLLICRSLEDKNKMLKRCQDTAKDDRGFVVVLEDSDIEKLLEEKQSPSGLKSEYTILREQMENLIG